MNLCWTPAFRHQPRVTWDVSVFSTPSVTEIVWNVGGTESRNRADWLNSGEPWLSPRRVGLKRANGTLWLYKQCPVFTSSSHLRATFTSLRQTHVMDNWRPRGNYLFFPLRSPVGSNHSGPTAQKRTPKPPSLFPTSSHDNGWNEQRL